MIEKAWAKIHKGYDKIKFGKANEFLWDLTGAPTFDYDVKASGIH